MHTRLGLLGVVVVSLVAVLVLSSCQAVGGAASGPIKLGVIAPLTGGGTSYGLGIKQGAQMAVDEINQAGGVNGRKIDMVTEDDASDPAQSVTAMTRLVDSDKADVIVGGWGSSQVLAHQPVAEKAGVPYIIVGATSPKITNENVKWSFRVIQTDAIQAVEIANAALDNLKASRIAVIFDSNDYGTGNRDVFAQRLKERNVQPVAVESYQTNDKDWTAQLTKIRDANPDVLAVFGTIPAAPAIMTQARQLGIKARFIGTGGLANEQLMGLGGAAVEGTILTTYFQEDTDPEAKAWADKYTQLFASSSNPPRPVLAAWEYRAVKQILLPVLQKAGSDKEAIRSGLQNFKGHVFGLQDEVYFDKTHQLVQHSVLTEVKDGKFALFAK